MSNYSNPLIFKKAAVKRPDKQFKDEMETNKKPTEKNNHR